MKYSIYKDSDVNKTVDKIKKITSDCGIELEELIIKYPIQDKRMPASVRLFCFGESVSNGKGTSLENARASAYAEFIERFQNVPTYTLNLKFNKFKYAPDEKFYKKIDNNFFEKFYTKEEINCINKMPFNYNEFYTVPFYSVKDKKSIDMPIKTLLDIQGSNGMCAGNTPEEALVQGLSELCERHSLKNFLLNNISLPDIPKEVWGKFDRIIEMKEYIEQYGYEVRIKDASLGENLPVVCTLFENKKEGFWGSNIGSQPSLPIAIERTFTEFMQGTIPRYETNKTDIDDNIKFIDRSYLYNLFTNSVYLLKKEQVKSLYEQLFLNPPDYEFSPSSWVNDTEEMTNKALLEFLIKNVKILSDNNIYVRDSSFMNFPAYYIYIPNISEVNIPSDIKRLKKEKEFVKWISYTRDNHPENNDIESLMSALDFKINYIDANSQDDDICHLPNEYLLLLCYLVKQDLNNIIKYCKFVLNKYKKESFYPKCEFIYKYYSYKKKYTDDFRKYIEKYYAPDYINNFEYFISGFNFDKLKNIIRENNNLYNARQFQKYKIKKLKYDYKFEEKDISAEIQNKTDLITQKTEQKYLINTPNQMALKEVFDFI